jgi:RND superfamily putative drug exporter
MMTGMLVWGLITGDEFMNKALERLGGFAARRWWAFIIVWIVILGGLLGAKHAFGGEYVNNYTVAGTGSSDGVNLLNSKFPQQGGYTGQIVFHARTGTLSAQAPPSTRPPPCRQAP